jgi:hypothetical protein
MPQYGEGFWFVIKAHSSAHIEIWAGGCNAEDGPKDKQDVELFFAEALRLLCSGGRQKIRHEPQTDETCEHKKNPRNESEQAPYGETDRSDFDGHSFKYLVTSEKWVGLKRMRM